MTCYKVTLKTTDVLGNSCNIGGKEIGKGRYVDCFRGEVYVISKSMDVITKSIPSEVLLKIELFGVGLELNDNKGQHDGN